MKKQIYSHRITLMIILVTLTFFTKSCDTSSDVEDRSKSEQDKASREASTAVVNWYDLQLQIILKANPAISPILLNRAFGYIGIGLYESVRPGISKSVSLSEKLFEMPTMPDKENNNGYEWGVSANAALARLIANFYPEAVVTLNKQRIDSLEAAYNDSTSPRCNLKYSNARRNLVVPLLTQLSPGPKQITAIFPMLDISRQYFRDLGNQLHQP